MAKGGKGRKSNSKNPKKSARHYQDIPDGNMDDEIDAFHKQRDVIPLDMNDDVGNSDEENEHPVFDFKDANDEDDDNEDDIEDDTQLTGLAAKIARQQRYLRAKIGGVEDEAHDDAEDEEDNKRAVWGRRKNIYYDTDNVDYELQSSDDDDLRAEEAEVLRLQKEKAKVLSMEDFGLEDDSQDESGGEPTFEEILVKGNAASKASPDKVFEDETGTAFEVVTKDLNVLSREEQMEVVYNSAPELVGLLSELNDALEQLENRVNPIISKVSEGENEMKKVMQYMELKKQLLLSYCQAITFYLLLKSEGVPVRDHPVIERLVEIKNLLDKVKQLDGNLPSEIEDILNKKHGTATAMEFSREDATLESNTFTKDQKPSVVLSETQEVPREAAEFVKVDSSREYEKKGKRKRQNDQLGLQSLEMLKVRAALEEKLKQKGVFSSTTPKRDGAKKNLHPVNGQLEALDDFNDDAINIEGSHHGTSNGHVSLLRSSKLAQLITPQVKKPKVISGDDDLPKRDDIGERRRKHELRVLAGAGIESDNDFQNDEPGTLDGDRDDDMEGDDEPESDLELYKQVEQRHAAKVAAKAEKYSRTPAIPSLPETFVDGKRNISYQMEKNRGLTRPRKKLTKNPRKKYKLKHQNAVARRKGQVREMKLPSGPYGGEVSGINAGISRSNRLNT